MSPGDGELSGRSSSSLHRLPHDAPDSTKLNAILIITIIIIIHLHE